MFPLKWFSDVKHAILIKPLNTKSLIKVGMYKKMSLKRNVTTSLKVLFVNSMFMWLFQVFRSNKRN